jgi:hypothetical protein
VGISRDYPLKTRTSKQPTGKIPEYELIPSHPLKYPRSKQGLKIQVTLRETIRLVQGSFLLDKEEGESKERGRPVAAVELSIPHPSISIGDQPKGTGTRSWTSRDGRIR